MKMARLSGGHQALWLGAGLLLSGCTTIDRPTGPGAEEPVGPHSVIVQPAHDTTIAAGQALNVLVTVTSAHGIDTVYYEVTGATTGLTPLTDVESPVTFGFTVPAGSLLGDAVVIRVNSVDSLGQAGDTAVRFVQIQ
ncbi:MAG: hypothetical protein ABJC74_00510 [Gemmatimonadota bacterium]